MHGVPPNLSAGTATSLSRPPTSPDLVSSTPSALSSPSTVPDPRASGWGGLTAYLNALDQPTVVLSFKQIEEIIGSELPSSAAALGYWSNSVYNTMARRWWDAGFRTSTRGLPEGHIRFDRVTFSDLAG